MNTARENAVRRMLDEGQALLAMGRAHEAADFFQRVLFQEPQHPEAQEGLTVARAALAEEQRVLHVRVDEAAQAIERGEPEVARRLLDEVLDRGGDRDRALRLLDRIDGRSGRISVPPGVIAPPRAHPRDGVPRASQHWPRRLVVATWGVAFALLAAGVASSWERLVDRLVEAPSPTSLSAPPTTHVPAPTAGERAVARARRLVEEGDAHGALAVLDGIHPQEPSYPFARQLRGQIEQALKEAAMRPGRGSP